MAVSIDSPCTDVPHLSVGAQNITLDYSTMPAAWFGLGSVGECDVFDVFGTSTQPAKDVGKSLGRFTSAELVQEVPPHGSRLFVLSGCK